MRLLLAVDCEMQGGGIIAHTTTIEIGTYRAGSAEGSGCAGDKTEAAVKQYQVG